MAINIVYLAFTWQNLLLFDGAICPDVGSFTVNIDYELHLRQEFVVEASNEIDSISIFFYANSH